MLDRVQLLIDSLGLQPHPEGGFYIEVYRSQEQVQADQGLRDALTSIYFLLPKGVVSAWHKVKSDEVWIHVEGAPLELAIYREKEKQGERVVLGDREHLPPVYQATVRAHDWQAARSCGDFSLVCCLVAPGFVFEDFEMLDCDELELIGDQAFFKNPFGENLRE